MTLKQNSATNKIKIKIFAALILFFTTSYLLPPNSYLFAAPVHEKIDIAVTDMWLNILTSFIGGEEVNVIPIKIWNANGDLVLADRGKVLKELSSDVKIIALDEKDASTIKGLEKFNVHCLYSSFPVERALLIDPSVIPFVAQKILAALSLWDADDYPYYQRRLAEFQARLSGSWLVGQVLHDVTVCDLSGSFGVVLKATGCKIESPEKENLEKWRKGNFAGLRDYLDGMKSQGIITVYDDETPPALKKYLAGRSDTFHWPRPAQGVDYPTFLNEQYIALWQKISNKPLK